MPVAYGLETWFNLRIFWKLLHMHVSVTLYILFKLSVTIMVKGLARVESWPQQLFCLTSWIPTTYHHWVIVDISFVALRNF